MQYFIIEIQNRVDGINNVQPIVARNSLATGLSYFYQRCSTMVANTDFPTVTVMIIDQDGTVVKNEHFATAYVEPVEPAAE